MSVKRFDKVFYFFPGFNVQTGLLFIKKSKQCFSTFISCFCYIKILCHNNQVHFNAVWFYFHHYWTNIIFLILMFRPLKFVSALYEIRNHGEVRWARWWRINGSLIVCRWASEKCRESTAALRTSRLYVFFNGDDNWIITDNVLHYFISLNTAFNGYSVANCLCVVT